MLILRTTLTLFSVLSLCWAASAQTNAPQSESMPNPPRTADGYPDLQGSWTNASVTRLERTNQTDKLVLAPEEARRLEAESIFVANDNRQRTEKIDVNSPPPAGEGAGGANFGLLGYNSFWLAPGDHFATVKGQIRSSWITEPEDGRRPRKPGVSYGPYGGGPGHEYDGPETRSAGERCLAYMKNGPVMINSGYNNNYQIVQTADHVMILPEMVRDPRIIPIFDGPDAAKHRPDVITPWYGDSVGWYEGDTLVVETINVEPQQRSMLSPSGKLIERFSWWSDDQILYEFEVDDPDKYTRTWKGEMSLSRFNAKMYEYACHEGNYSMSGILAGARVQEARRTQASAIVGEEE